MPSVSDYTDEQLGRFKEELAANLDRITTLVRRKLAEARTDDDGRLQGDGLNLALARALGDDLVRLLGDAFESAQRRFRDAVAGLAEVVGADLASQGLDDRLTSAAEGTIATFVGHGLDDLISVQGQAAEDLRNAVVQSVTTNASIEDAIEQVAGSLGRTVAQATTLVDTTISGLDRAVVVQQAEDVGVVAFLYAHPDDGLTRPWCAPRANKAFLASEMDREPNTTGPNPPSIYCGGWRCRGRWEALFPENIAAGVDWYYPKSSAELKRLAGR